MKTNTLKLRHLIKETVDKIKGELDGKDCNINFLEQEDGGYLIWDFALKKAVIVNTFIIKDKNKKPHYIVASFKINIKLYNWARAEGFTEQKMIDDFQKKIFNPISLDRVVDYMCGKI